MPHRHDRVHRVLDLIAELDQLAQPIRLHDEPRLRSVEVRVEGAAEHDVDRQRAEARRLDAQVAMQDEARHAAEAHFTGAPAVEAHERLDEAGWRVEADARLGLHRLHHAELDQRLAERDDAVPAHVAVAFVVHEDHAEVGLFGDRRQQIRAVHVGMAARLVHQQAAQRVEARLRISALLEDRAPAQRRRAGRDHAQRLAAGMQVDGLNRAAQLDHGVGAEAYSVISGAGWPSLNVNTVTADDFRSCFASNEYSPATP